MTRGTPELRPEAPSLTAVGFPMMCYHFSRRLLQLTYLHVWVASGPLYNCTDERVADTTRSIR